MSAGLYAGQVFGQTSEGTKVADISTAYGLTSLAVGSTPEPSLMALAGLGGGCLLVLRRRN